MPFKSEKQRKYLWANEPGIARDWTDKYGSGIAKALGGRIPLANGNFITGQHFGDEGNRQQLINAMDRGLINERDYKLMSGYDASQEIMGLGGPNWNPLKAPANFAASGIYNLGKKALHPEDYEGRIGAWDSTLLNTMGSMGYGFNKDQYEGILGLNPEAFNRSPTGPYGSNYSSQLAQLQGLAPAYDFDEPSGEIMKVPRQTMAADQSIPFNQQYLEGSGWLNDARTADEMAQLPIDALPNKRQKVTDFLSRFIPGAGVAKMLRPDANEAYGNVAQLYPEEVFGMQEFGSGEDLRTDPWGKNIVSFAGDYEQGKKDWWDKYGKMKYKTKRMKQKKEWHRQAVEKIRQEEAAREQRKRAQVQAMSHQNRIQNTGGWQSGMAEDEAFMTGPAKGEQLSDVMGSFNRGGLASLWPR